MMGPSAAGAGAATASGAAAAGSSPALAARLASRLEERFAIMTGDGGVAARRRPPVEQGGRKTIAEDGSSSMPAAASTRPRGFIMANTYKSKSSLVLGVHCSDARHSSPAVREIYLPLLAFPDRLAALVVPVGRRVSPSPSPSPRRMCRRPACLILLLSVCGARALEKDARVLRRKLGKRRGGSPRERLDPWRAALPAAYPVDTHPVWWHPS